MNGGHTGKESNPHHRILAIPTSWCGALPIELPDGVKGVGGLPDMLETDYKTN